MFCLVNVGVGVDCGCNEKEFFAILDTDDTVVEWHNSDSVYHFVRDCNIKIVGLVVGIHGDITVGNIQHAPQYLFDNVEKYKSRALRDKLDKDCIDLFNKGDIFKEVRYEAMFGELSISDFEDYQ